jgi:hypothetical protein
LAALKYMRSRILMAHCGKGSNWTISVFTCGVIPFSYLDLTYVIQSERKADRIMTTKVNAIRLLIGTLERLSFHIEINDRTRAVSKRSPITP